MIILKHYYRAFLNHDRNLSVRLIKGSYLLVFVLVLLSAATVVAGNLTAQEYGDPVYRELDSMLYPGVGHTGLYCGMDGSDTHMVIQMIDDHIRDNLSLDSFKQVTTYWGAYSSANSAERPDTFAERETIILYADELKVQDPDYTLFDCLNPLSGWGDVIDPGEVDELRCDGLVEYCYEYGTDFPVWGRNGAHYDISIYYTEHNDPYVNGSDNPDTSLAPVVQCGRAGGSSTCLTNSAVIDYPVRTVSSTYYSDRTVVLMRAADQSGIHEIRYKWGSGGTEHSVRYAQHPVRDYEELIVTTYSSNDLYFRVQDGAGNSDGLWHVYPITVTPAAEMPANISVPLSDGDGSYVVNWGVSGTAGAAYVLQEATDAGFSSNIRDVYSGSSTSVMITGRSAGLTYFYRVKAVCDGYNDSPWRVGANGCTLPGPELTVYVSQEGLCHGYSPCYSAISDAYQNMESGQEAKIEAGAYAGDLLCARAVNVTLSGGWNPEYSENAGNHSIVGGCLTITAGTVTVAGLVIDGDSSMCLAAVRAPQLFFRPFASRLKLLR